MSGKVLNRLRVHPCIEKIGNVSVPQLMWCHIKIYRISDFGLILLCHAQRWSNCIFDTLTIYILIVVPGLSGTDNYILPYPLKL